MRCVVVLAVLLAGCAANEVGGDDHDYTAPPDERERGTDVNVSPYVACEPYADRTLAGAWPACNKWSDWWYYFN